MDRRQFITRAACASLTLPLSGAASESPVSLLSEMARPHWPSTLNQTPDNYLKTHSISHPVHLSIMKEFEVLTKKVVWVEGELFTFSELAWMITKGSTL